MDQNFSKELQRVLDLLLERASYFNNFDHRRLFKLCFTNYGISSEGLDKIIKNTRFTSAREVYLEYLKWVNKHFSVKPTQSGINRSINNKMFLGYFLNKAWYPNQIAITRLIENNKLKTLKILSKYGIVPDDDNIILATELKRKKILKWCASKDLTICQRKD
jgi:hypothetical protein